MKRTLDILLASIGLLFFGPIIVWLILLIRKDSPGPGLFKQKRVGKDGLSFTCYKLRTMTVDTPNLPSHYVSYKSLTKIGSFLRKTKLDELPQLYNVLCGDMSFVGPRPCLPEQNILIQARRQNGTIKILPGITGLAQIRGIDMSHPTALAEVDGEYLHKRSFFLDIKILLLTFIGFGRNSDRVSK